MDILTPWVYAPSLFHACPCSLLFQSFVSCHLSRERVCKRGLLAPIAAREVEKGETPSVCAEAKSNKKDKRKKTPEYSCWERKKKETANRSTKETLLSRCLEISLVDPQTSQSSRSRPTHLKLRARCFAVFALSSRA
jgi:hypothetical protein